RRAWFSCLKEYYGVYNIHHSITIRSRLRKSNRIDAKPSSPDRRRHRMPGMSHAVIRPANATLLGLPRAQPRDMLVMWPRAAHQLQGYERDPAAASMRRRRERLQHSPFRAAALPELVRAASGGA